MGILDSLKAAAGGVEKAVIIIGDTSEVAINETAATNPSAGSGFGAVPGIGSNLSKLKEYTEEAIVGSMLTSDQKKSDHKFEMIGKVKKYRFEVQFNPAEVTISGYGGEMLPMQNYIQHGSNNKQNNQNNNENSNINLDPKKKRKAIGSRMAASDIRITMNFKLIFDKVDPQDAFYSDKFTLGTTSIAQGAGKAIAKAVKKDNSVQNEVEALHAIARSSQKRLALFIWGDMVYEGVINSVSSNYVMFNVNGEPIRAYVNMGMVLYSENDLGKNISRWRGEYNRSIYSMKSDISNTLNAGIGS